MSKHHEKMSLDECYETLAEMGACRRQSRQFHPKDVTLDAVAACLPDGWRLYGGVSQYAEGWMTEAAPASCWDVDDVREFDKSEVVALRCQRLRQRAWGDTEILARARLAVACWRATVEVPA